MPTLISALLCLWRWCIAIPGLLIAAYAILPQTSRLSWYFGLAVGEAGWLLALCMLLVLLPGWWRRWWNKLPSTMAMAAAILGMVSTAQALVLGSSLNADLTTAFGPTAVTSATPSVLPRGLPWDSGCPELPLQHHRYSEAHQLSLSAIRPAGDQLLPALVVIHGGGWRSGNRSQSQHLDGCLAQQGLVIISIDHRKSGQAPYPAAVNDVNEALQWVQNNAQKLGYDGQRMLLLGRSSGAHLAALVANTKHYPQLRGVIGLYGIYDLAHGYANPQDAPAINGRKVLRQFMSGTPAQQPEAYERASAYHAVSSDSPPMLLIHGSKDSVVPAYQSARMAKQLQQAGVKTYYLQLPWASHGYDLITHGPASQLGNHAVHWFINRQLLPSTGTDSKP